jgi:hypothetical protein
LTKRLFVEAFRAIVNGRRRYLRRTTTAQRAAEPDSQLAIAVDRFLREAGAFYSDAEVFLRLNEEPVEEA